MKLLVRFLLVLTVTSAAGCGRIGYAELLDSSEATDDGGGVDTGLVEAGAPNQDAGLPFTGELVAYWPLDEPISGTDTFEDATGNGHDLTCATDPEDGCPESIPGIRGSGVWFRNSGFPRAEAIGTPSVGALATLSNQITVAAWVRLHDYTRFGYIVSNDRDCSGCGASRGYSLAAHRYDGPAFQLWAGEDPSTILEGPPIPLDEWHFLAATYDGVTMRLYVDDAMVASEANPLGFTNPPSHATQLGGMGYDPWRGIDGDVDEVMLFRRALTGVELEELRAFFLP